jgi:hypothetical protein
MMWKYVAGLMFSFLMGVFMMAEIAKSEEENLEREIEYLRNQNRLLKKMLEGRR